MTAKLVTDERIAELADGCSEWVNGAWLSAGQQKIEAIIRTAVREAGEAAAKVCEHVWNDAPNTRLDGHLQNLYSHGCIAAAAAIRERLA